MILIIDNYDSFTYNLVDMFSQYTEVKVIKPDEAPLNLEINGLVISPGPGHPTDSNELINIIHHYQDKPILGICLGAQALTCYYGGEVIVGKEVKHGKVDKIKIQGESILYKKCPHTFNIMRYHSLVSNPATFPSCLKVTGITYDAIQSFEHEKHLHFGIQYHPESFASEYGMEIIKAFIKLTEEGVKDDNNIIKEINTI